MHRFVGILGMLTMMSLAFVFSTNRRAIRYKTVAWGLGLQIVFAFMVLRWDGGRAAFAWLGDKVNWILGFANYGATFVFGPLAQNVKPWGIIFAFQVLAGIIFIAALFALLYYLGVMQLIIRGAAVFMTKLMGTSGAESLNVAASIFMGQTEAPLTIRPYLPDVTQSELMTIMTSGMAHVSGGIMVAYIAYGIQAKHLLAAVIMTAPGHDSAVEDACAGNREAAHGGARRNDAHGTRHERLGGDCPRNHRRSESCNQRRGHAHLVHRADLSG